MGSNDCKPIPVLPYDGFNVPMESTNCNAYKAARALYDEVAPKVVMVEAGKTPPHNTPASELKVGSGFFVRNGNEVVTNTHVAAAGPYLEVKTLDGSRYSARIEKLDDINDLALLKLEGILPDAKRSVDIGSTDALQLRQELIAYSHPLGLQDVYASSGYYRDRGSLTSMLPSPTEFPDLQPIVRRIGSSNTSEATEAQNYMNADRLRLRVNIMHSSSGSPLVDTKGTLVGVTANRVTPSQGLFIPAERVADLLKNPESRFNFNYASDGANFKLLSIERKDGSKIPPMNLTFDKDEPPAAPKDWRGPAPKD